MTRDSALEAELARCLDGESRAGDARMSASGRIHTGRRGPRADISRQDPPNPSTVRTIGRPIYAFQQLGSTMDEAHRLAQEGAPEGALVLALRQEQGRGRLGRTWVSPDGGLYCSIVLRPKQPAAAQLSLVAGLAAAETLRDAACVYPSIKWPNDLLLGGKKLGGILAEARDGAVILGIGINVSRPAEALPDTATSLAASGASHCSRDDVLAGLCRKLSGWYDVWAEQGFAPIREALRPWMGHFGQPVKLTAGSSQLEGVAQDLDEQGRLVVRLDSGILRAFDAGEVTLLR